jgi:hypothetical protein
MLTVGQMSTIAWVVSEQFRDDRKITKELIANCYQASIPDEDFDKKLKEVLSRTDMKMTHELYKNAFVIQSIRQVALSQTAGHSALVSTLNLAEVLAEAETVREAALTDARAEERTLAEVEIEARSARRKLERASSLATTSARAIMVLLLIVVGFAIVREHDLLFHSPELRVPIAVLLALVGILHVADLFELVRVASFRVTLVRWLTSGWMKVQDVLT